METLRHIVVGTDFSSCADRALEAAIALGTPGVTEISLVHVCTLSLERGVPDAMATPSLDDELLAACRERLARVVGRNTTNFIPITGVLRTGRPWEKLNNVAAEVGASLIVIGRHGDVRGLRSDLGVVAERVLRSASRPVLLVPGGLVVLVVE